MFPGPKHLPVQEAPCPLICKLYTEIKCVGLSTATQKFFEMVKKQDNKRSTIFGFTYS